MRRCWALHRTVRGGRVRDGILAALFVLAQFLSCIYYGVFLVVTAVRMLWRKASFNVTGR